MSRFLKYLKNHFVPHKDNDYHPHFLRHQSILALFLLIIVVQLAFLIQVFVVFDKTKFLASVLPGVLTALTNEERVEINLNTLKTNPLLEKAAQAKANDMANRGYFSHNTPEGKTPWYWLELVGYKYKYAGENLAVNFFESADVARAWMDSPTHKANIVKKDYTEIGIAVADGIYKGRNTVFVVQFFGTPKDRIPLDEPTAGQAGEAKPTDAGSSGEAKPTDVPIFEEEREGTLADISNTENPNTVLGEETPVMTQIETNSKVNTKDTTSFKLYFQKIATSPSITLNYIFIMIALLIGVVIIITLFVKSEKRHPKFMTQGLFLVSIIAMLFFLNMSISNHRADLPLNIETNTTFAN